MEKPMRGSSPRRRREKGSVVAEVGLALPVMLFAMLGMVDIGRGVAAKAELGHAARLATRYASVRSATSGSPATNSSIESYLIGHVEGLDPDLIVVNTTWNPANSRGSKVQVSVTYDFAPIMPFIPIESIELASSSESIISN
jgi:Flp pilus assembly protein TadG